MGLQPVVREACVGQGKAAKNRLACTLFDTERFAHQIEAAYVHMRDRAERGLALERFSVSALSPPPSITRETCGRAHMARNEK
jgi:hypothetical protein